MSRVRKFLWLGLAVALLVGYLLCFGIQTFCCWLAWRTGRQVPIVKSMPIDLSDFRVSTDAGKKLSFRGAEFELPWTDIDETKTKIVGNWLVVYFQSGKSMIVCVSPAGTFLHSITKDASTYERLFTQLYGPEVLRSDYEVHKAIFQTSPRQITLLTPPNRALGLSMVLTMKAVMPPTTDWAIYNVHTDEFTGFQLGSPARRARKICLEMFAGDLDVEINLTQPENGPTHAISQAELNRMLRTLHRSTEGRDGFKIANL